MAQFMKSNIRVLIDARELVPGRTTGIGRVLLGIVGAIGASALVHQIVLAGACNKSVPAVLLKQRNISLAPLPSTFIGSEFFLSLLSTKSFDLFISPYPKLPIFGCKCLSINIVHDVFYISHPAYRNRVRSRIDLFRLRRDLKRADMTWFDSKYSKREAERLSGFKSGKGQVRYPGLDNNFRETEKNDGRVLEKYHLKQGYLLVVGNGNPHKNLGVLLTNASAFDRPVVILGARRENKNYWRSQYPNSPAQWLGYVAEQDLPSLLRQAFCLLQPSTAEGYGYPPLEAMASGTPAIVSNIPILIETTGGKALYADPYDPDSWLMAISDLENEDVYQAIAKRGLQWVHKFKGARAWEKYIQDIEALIEEYSK